LGRFGPAQHVARIGANGCLAPSLPWLSSIEARFLPPEGQKYCCLAIAKFTQGEFVGYADLTIPVDSFVPQKHYQAELGWCAERGRSVFS